MVWINIGIVGFLILGQNGIFCSFILFPMTVLSVVLVAVGSEDCSIGVYSLPATAVAKSSIEPVLTLQGHVSAVKALSRSWSPHRQLLFSGGGRASLKVWSVTENMESGKLVL